MDRPALRWAAGFNANPSLAQPVLAPAGPLHVPAHSNCSAGDAGPFKAQVQVTRNGYL